MISPGFGERYGDFWTIDVLTAALSSLSERLVCLFIMKNPPVCGSNQCLSSRVFRASRKAKNLATIEVKVHYRYLPKVEVVNKN